MLRSEANRKYNLAKLKEAFLDLEAGGEIHDPRLRGCSEKLYNGIAVAHTMPLPKNFFYLNGGAFPKHD